MASLPAIRIPKQYQQPRPTAVRERQRSLVERVPSWVRAGCVTLLMLWFAPFQFLDDALSVSLLAKSASSAPSATALRLRVDADWLERSDCGVRIATALREAGALGSEVLEPLPALCRVPGAHIIYDADARRDMFGRVGGWQRSASDSLQAFEDARWVRPLAPGGLPTLDWQQLESGQVGLDLLHGRHILISPELQAEPANGNDQFERAAAASITGEGIRRELPRALTLSLGVAALVGWAAVVARRGYARGLVMALLAFALLAATGAGLAAFAKYAVVPLVSLAFAWVCGAAAFVFPELLRERRAFLRANELVERAVLSRVRGLDQLDDAEFHAKVASLADQWHPANLVLVAQLPARKWHLQFWKYGSAGEELIDERRRDIRRTPYCDEAGVPTIRIVRNYLVMKEMPVLVVPLQALGEIEGYIFLCGDRAETAYRTDPSTAARLSVELALLMRRRRLGRASLSELSRAGPVASRGGEELANGARIVNDEMELLDSMVRDAPMGLLLADSFGHVRMLSREFSSWLGAFGANVPALREDALVPAGALMLVHVFEKLLGVATEAASRRVGELITSPEGLSLPLSAPAAQGGDALVLRCRALRRTVLSVEHVTGFVATLALVEGPGSRVGPSTALVAGADELSAFPLAALVREAVAGANRTLRRQAVLEPTWTQGHCIGKKALLTSALRGFLVASAAQPPVLVLRERSRDLELTLHDLDPGVPAGALDRVMNAPHHPPPGLEALAHLILAVEECHGSMRVVSGRGWGSKLILRLHRARSVMLVGHSRRPSARAVSEGSTRTSLPPPVPRPAPSEPPSA